jgi:hypothetical protein
MFEHFLNFKQFSNLNIWTFFMFEFFLFEHMSAQMGSKFNHCKND